MDVSRRELTMAAVALAAAAQLPRAAVAGAAERAPASGSAEKIAMVLYPNMTALDLVGPLYALGGMRGAQVQLVAARPGPLMADRHLGLVANASYDDVPKDLDALFVPGGYGAVDAMKDEALLAFLADRGARAKYVTSVCTGSLILGAAGLLDGYRATSHWAFRDAVLPLLGAVPVNKRYVIDRNRITGGGVTAGIDFGLRLVAQFRGEPAARLTQLNAEYDPDPPFAGSPEKALPQTLADAKAQSAELLAKAMATAKAVRRG